MKSPQHVSDPALEWIPVRDRAGHFLFALSLVTGNIRIKKGHLTTEVDVKAVRNQAVRRWFEQHYQEEPYRS